jgi:hypothetical protein
MLAALPPYFSNTSNHPYGLQRWPPIRGGLQPEPGHVEVEQRAIEVSWSAATPALAQARGTL